MTLIGYYRKSICRGAVSQFYINKPSQKLGTILFFIEKKLKQDIG